MELRRVICARAQNFWFVFFAHGNFIPNIASRCLFVLVPALRRIDCSACSKGFSPGTDYSCRECSYYDTRRAAQIASAVIVGAILFAAGIYTYLGRRVDGETMEGLAAPQSCVRRKCTSFRDSLMKALPLTAIKILVVVWQIVFQVRRAGTC